MSVDLRSENKIVSLASKCQIRTVVPESRGHRDRKRVHCISNPVPPKGLGLESWVVKHRKSYSSNQRRQSSRIHAREKQRLSEKAE